MIYYKPEVVKLSCAIKAIQSTAKDSVHLETHDIHNSTVAAYDGDE
jgi:hypothetical protein